MPKLREIPAVRCAAYAVLEVVARNHHDAFVSTIPVEQFGAIPKETRVRQTIILHDDSLLYLFKGPVQSARDAPAAAHVRVGEIREDLTGPIHPVQDFARLPTERRFSRGLDRGPSATISSFSGRASLILSKTRKVSAGRLKIKKIIGGMSLNDTRIGCACIH